MKLNFFTKISLGISLISFSIFGGIVLFSPAETSAATSCTTKSCNLTWVANGDCTQCFTSEECIGGNCYSCSYGTDSCFLDRDPASGKYCSSGTPCQEYYCYSYCGSTSGLSTGGCKYDCPYNIKDACGGCPAGKTCSGGNCVTSCTPSWSCTGWSPSPGDTYCGYDVNQTQTCTDSNNCGTTSGKPAESRTVKGSWCPATDPGTCSYASDCATSGSRTETTYTCYQASKTCSPSTSSKTCSRTTDGSACGSDSGPSCRYSSTCDAWYYKNTCSSGSCVGATTWTIDASNNSACDGTTCATGKVCSAGSCVTADSTKPETSITAPDSGSWQRSNFSVSVSDTDNIGVTSCYYGVYDGAGVWTIPYTTTRTCNTAVTLTVGTSLNCRTQGANSCTIYMYSRDAAGNESLWASRSFSIDYTLPNTPSIDSPAANSTQSSDFSVSVSNDGDTGGSGVSCYYHALDSSASFTKSWEPRTCNSSFTVTVGPSGDCRTSGGTCTIYAIAKDGAGNVKESTRMFNIRQCSALSYPSDTWQRVWRNFDGSCLGDGPNEPTEKFDTNWSSGVLAWGKSDKIQFSSSRKINFSAGTYAFTVGSDDGIKLWIDDELKIDKWVNRGYTTDSINVSFSADAWHNFKIDYYENDGGARASFSYTIPALDQADCNNLAMARGGYTQGVCRWSGEAINCGTSYQDTLPDVGQCNESYWGFSGNIICYGCHNCSTVAPSKTVQVGKCNVAITSKGWDVSDGAIGGYREFDQGPNSLTIGVDVDPGGACNSNLRFQNSWTVTGDRLTITANQLSAGTSHKMFGGYQIDVSDAVAGANCKVQWCQGTVAYCRHSNCSGNNRCVAFSNSTDAEIIYYEEGCSACSDTSGSVTTNLSYCGDGEVLNGEVCDPGANPSCKPDCSGVNDNTLPESEITSVLPVNWSGPDRWLKGGVYTISITDTDPGTSPSGINTSSCAYNVYDIGRMITTRTGIRTCNSTISIDVGSGRDCETQESNKCRIGLYVKDNAGNDNGWQYKFLNIDITPPSVQ